MANKKKRKQLKKSQWLLAQLVFALEVELEDKLALQNKVLRACLESAQDYLEARGLNKHAARSNHVFESIDAQL